MAKHMKPVKVTPASDLVTLLDEVDSGVPVLLERRGVVYQLHRVDEADVGDDVAEEDVRQILDETIGSWADLDIDQMIEDIYKWREAGTRPPDRP